MSKPSSHSYHSGINKWQKNKNKCGVAACGIMLVTDFMKIHPLVEKLLRVSHIDMVWRVTHSVILTPYSMVQSPS